MKRLTACLLALLCLAILAVPIGHGAKAASTLPTAGKVTTASTSLLVRAQASTSSAIIGSLARGSYVTLYEKSGGWWRVKMANGTYGYSSASYITQVSGSEAMTVTATALNIRSGPSTSYSIQTSLSKGTTVVKLSVSGNFANIVYNGTKTGYASLSYLSAASGSSANPSQTYAPVSLSVPSYKQTDSRWASVLVGSTGRTIADIGCATTALAMTESYRTGTTITPATMESRLTYTSGGAVYWPDTYVLGGAMSYSELYAKLKSGTPVIVGGKTSSGSTHFVVVKGFTGGSSLTAAGFTINDPGSNSRTTLSQFLAVYPTVYRTVYAK